MEYILEEFCPTQSHFSVGAPLVCSAALFVTPTVEGPVVRGRDHCCASVAWLGRTQLSRGVERPLCCSQLWKQLTRSPSHTGTHTHTNKHIERCITVVNTLLLYICLWIDLDHALDCRKTERNISMLILHIW